MRFTFASAASASVFLPHIFIGAELMGTQQDVSRQQPPCQQNWLIPGVFSATPTWSNTALLYAWHLRGLHLCSERDPVGQSAVTLYEQNPWISLQTWVGDGLSDFAPRRPFLLMFQQWVTAAHINRYILTSQVGTYGQRASDVWENRADTGSGTTWSRRQARSSDHVVTMDFFTIVSFKRANQVILSRI